MVIILLLGPTTPSSQTFDPTDFVFQGHPERQALLDAFRLGMDARNRGRVDEAIGYFTEILDVVPDDPVTLYHRALARLGAGAFGDAVMDFERLLTLEPSLLRARLELAEAHVRQGRFDEAIQRYVEILDRQPGDLVARWNLRVVYEARGGYPEELALRYRIALPSGSPSPVHFTDVAPALGVDTMSRARGSAWADIDGDGDSDLVAVGIQHPHVLYRNEGDGTFTDVTEAVGLADPRGGWASIFFDYDGDRDVDLFVTRDGWRGEAPNSLYRNDGSGTFVDVAGEAGIAGAADSFTATVADVDRDGWLDVYVANGVTHPQGLPNALYRNQGDGTFTDIAFEAGVANPGRSIGSAFGDYDNDGWADLWVVNMDGPNALYHNDGDGTFTDVTDPAGLDAPTDGFVGFFFDYDNDGWLDLFATGWTQNMAEILLSAVRERPVVERNRLALYHNNGDGTFADVTREAGLARTYGAMAAQYGDVDGDGYLDIYLGTGSPPMTTHEPNKLFLNDGRGRFLDVTEDAGVGNLGKGHGATFSDYDRDGDLDLYAPIGGAEPGDLQPNSLYRNEGTPHHWLGLRIVGVGGNRAAVGARLRIRTDIGVVHRDVAVGTGFGSMNDPRMVIGVGMATKVHELRVLWPSGAEQVFVDLPLDQEIVLTQEEIRDAPEATSGR